MKTYIYTIEFQKRELTHVHLFIALEDHCKFRDFKDIDSEDIVSAEILDSNHDSILHNLVKKHSIHGPLRESKFKECMNGEWPV